MEKTTVDDLIIGFSSLLEHAHPSVIPEFMLWLDNKVLQYKSAKLSGIGESFVCASMLLNDL